MEYDGKEFNDPVLRCDQCSELVHRLFLSAHGGCNHCGNRRVRNVQGLNADEFEGLTEGTLNIGIQKPYTIDPDFMALFEVAEVVK